MNEIIEWLTIFFRWGHVLFAITWIGTSFYFNWFDLSVRPVKENGAKENIRGALHEVHGGSFYYHEQFWPDHARKRLLNHSGPAQFTFLSGLGLIFLVYWLHADTYLVDSSIAGLSGWQAVAISIGGLVAAWPIYYCLVRLIHKDRILFWAMGLLTLVASWSFTHLFGVRGAFIQVGAMLGTIMALNVYFVIVPNHKSMIGMIKDGEKLNIDYGLRAKRVSKHNNYITLPVLFAMLSTHFSLVSSADLNWLVLVVIMFGGVLLRHWRNVEHVQEYSDRRILGLTIAVFAIAIGLAQVNFNAISQSSASAVDAITDDQALALVHKRCTVCHSQTPSSDMFKSAPLGFRLDTLHQLKSNASLVRQRAVKGRSMPLGNRTGMTDEERQQLGTWIDQLN